MNAFQLLLKVVTNLAYPVHPAYLVFFVTSRCNCRCSWCFNWRNVHDDEVTEELSLRAIEKLARSMRTLPQLLLSGGEPFLRPDIAEIVEIFYRYAGTRQISIPTNGGLPRRINRAVTAILEKCPKAYINVNLSLDGIGEDHDRSRGIAGTFDRLCETHQYLKNLQGRHHRLCVNFLTVIKSDNAHKALDIVRYVKNRFEPNYHDVGIVRGDVDKKEKNFDTREVENVLNSLYQKGDLFNKLPVFKRMAPSVAALLRKILIEAREQNKRCFHCLAGKKMVVISPQGVMFPCEPLWLQPETRQGRNVDEFVMADLQRYDFNVRKALESPQSKRIKNFISDKKCWCDYGCAVLNSMMYCPLMYPRILKEITQSV